LSIQAVAWVLENSRTTGSARLVLISIANHASKRNDWEAWCASRTTAHEAGVRSHGTVLAAADRIEALGEIEILDRGGPRSSMRVRLLFMDDIEHDDVEGERSESDHPEQVCGQESTAAVSPDCPQRSAQTVQNRKEPELNQEPSSDAARPTPTTVEVRRVFDAWVESTEKTGRTQLDKKRQRLIVNALKAYPIEDVLDAVRGWRRSPHHRGENDSGAVYNDLGLLLRNAEKIEHFRDLERGEGPKPRGTPGPGRANPGPPPSCRRCGRVLDLCTCAGGPTP
jgi:hypothetical protein